MKRQEILYFMACFYIVSNHFNSQQILKKELTDLMKISYKLFLSIFLLAWISFSYTYNIQSESECLTFDPTYKVCSKWSQSGTINQDVSCFIGQTLVKEQSRGFIQIKDLNEGDKILTLKEGKETWSKIEGWLHKSDSVLAHYHNVTLQNGEWIGVSGKHNVAFKSKDRLFQYKFPSDNLEEELLHPCSKRISSKPTFTAVGKYAPLTSEFSYLIFTPTTFEPILVHDFAQIRNPEKYEMITNAIFATSKLIHGDHLLNAEGVNIAADWMMDNFSFLMD